MHIHNRVREVAAVWLLCCLLAGAGIVGGCGDDAEANPGGPQATAAVAGQTANGMNPAGMQSPAGQTAQGGMMAAGGQAAPPMGGTTAPSPMAPVAGMVAPVVDAGGEPQAGGQAPTPMGEDRWVSYGNGPRNWFHNPAEATLNPGNAANLTLKWQIDSEVTGPPVVLDGKAYVVTAHDGVYAFNLADGSEVWHEPSISTFSAPAYDPVTESIYVNSFEPSTIYSYAVADGAMGMLGRVTDQEASRGWSSPVVVGNRLIVGIASSDRGSFRGGLASFDLTTGSRAWEYIHAMQSEAGVSVWAGPSAEPDGTAIFAGSGNNYTMAGPHSDSLLAVDMGGTLLWNQQMSENDRWAYDCITCGPDHDFGTNPIVLEFGGRKLLAAGQKSGSFWMVDRETGEVLWEKQVSNNTSLQYGGVLNNGAFDGTRIIVAGNEGSRPGTLYALDPDPDANGRVLWERSLMGLVVAPITTAGGLAFVPVNDTLEVVNAETGDTVTTLPADATVSGGAAVSQGHVLFGCGLSYYDNGAIPGAFYVYGL